MMETKAQKFERVLRPRLEKVTHQIGLMGNLTNSAYESSPERRAQIISDLQASIDRLADEWKVAKPSVAPAPAPEAPTQIDVAFVTPPEVADAIGKRRIEEALQAPPTGAQRSPVDGRDRADIRAALHKAWAGDVKGGLQDIAHVVRGWPVADREAS